MGLVRILPPGGWSLDRLGDLTRVEDWVNGEPEFLSSNWDQSFIMSSSMYLLAILAMFCNKW